MSHKSILKRQQTEVWRSPLKLSTFLEKRYELNQLLKENAQIITREWCLKTKDVSRFLHTWMPLQI